ncbi:hypothetical protein QGM71_13670 [Virgibacillus sp. C22-A2]|uniref:Cytochrome-c oxidase n=1 Tax=Virgibacillus tibetensis TaxID=3042313 RepID=A0ABU6KGV5_9BACI|nr:hypothetical protein [Virgibacillus sp. C22-A2]
MTNYSKILLRLSAVFALIGVYLGSHMAGAGGYEFRTLHAHILVVGWLSLFAWAVYYKIFTPSSKKLAALHVWTAIIGSIGLTSGMWLYYLKPFDFGDTFITVYFIVGGTILLISFLFFAILTFMKTEEEK